MKYHLNFLVFLLFSVTTAFGQAVEIRVADIGAGMATVTKLPTGEVIVYDAGLHDNFMPTLRGMVPNKVIDLMILSHNDADHIGSVVAISQEFKVKSIVFSEYRGDVCERDSRKTYCKTMDAIRQMELEGTKVTRVTNSTPIPETVLLKVGEATVTYLCGFDNPDALWTFKSSDRPSKPRNAISLVVRLDYGNHSVLYCGDAVGKLEKSEDCVYTEKYLLEKVRPDLLDADIILAPHHGADNGSCNGFIKAVKPEYVIFSAGSEHGHPRLTTVDRYLSNGIKIGNIFRTDRGDDEEKYRKKEWAEGRITDCIDLPFDDDISISLPFGEKATVAYINPKGCACGSKKNEEH